MAIDEVLTDALQSGDGNAPATTTEVVETTDSDNKQRDIRSLLKAGFEEAKKDKSESRQAAAAARQRGADGAFVAKDKAAENTDSRTEPGKAPTVATAELGKEIPATTKPAEGQAAASTAAGEPPTSWSKDAKAVWATLPPAIQQAVMKREREAADGPTKVREQYRGIDAAIEPYRASLQQVGRTPEQAISQLFGWHTALSGPNKTEAFKALAQSHGINLSTLAPQSSGQSQQDPNASQQQPDIAGLLQEHVGSYVSPLAQELAALKQQMTESQNKQAADAISAFSKDKPHFERVRKVMGQLMGAGLATSLDDAYQKAVWADPDVRTELQADERARSEAEVRAQSEAKAKEEREAEARRKSSAQAQNAKRAAVSPRSGAPNGGGSATQSKSGNSVRETLRAAIEEHRA